MSLTIPEVEHVALLARLNLTEAEKIQYAKQLSDILQYAERLNALATDNVEPLAHVLPVFNVMREDAARPSLPRDEALSNAPKAEDGCFKVPKII
ncbi:MAG: Asp-tRNA(Asn)/Glu-tRNA(Gln) amidotransferase subunit GatC [Solirubrobacterales bacterium]